MKFSFLLTLTFLALLSPFGALAATRSLTLGDSGPDVTILQNILIAEKYLSAGKASGYFGPLTQSALEKFQCDKGIICAGASVEGLGIDGPKTQAALQIASAPTQPAVITSTHSKPATGAFEISGWLPYWRAASSTADVFPHLAQMKSVMPFAYSVRSDGTISNTVKINEEPWKSFVASAKAQRVRVVPTVLWGNGTQEDAILSNAASRVALENLIGSLARQNGFDGIDIDFEAKQAQTINYFSTFLKGLSRRMGTKWLYCTVEARMPLEDRYSPGATIPPDATQYANNYSAINKYCDRIELMAYDQRTIDIRLDAARSAPYAPVADPGWVEDLVTLAAQTISKNKMIVGVATYGYEYTITSLPDGTEQYKVLWPFNPLYATQIATQLNITPARTSAGELGFTYDPNGLATVAPTNGNSTQVQQAISTTSAVQNLGSQVNTIAPYNYVTWSDASAIKDKIDLAHRLGVRGVAFFSLGGAEDQGMWSVIK